ncbi:MarR family winged helix-turn-helix transcriptional regulator [Maritalea mobilis]|uniref:MarR family winged helix-turn-helix transcriptional regulator n=1 Tax=Maritalea mobilis TaxID=483324 RepID=UPI0021BBE5A1|nr:MarR family transcriptional regulator [Maritalea mobilis]
MSLSFRLDDFLPYRLAVLAGRVSREYADSCRSKYGLSRSEWRVLAHLNEEASVSVREIHRRVDMDKSKVSRAAARLEAAGLVTKTVSQSDRRLVELELTGEGKSIFHALAQQAHAFERELKSRLGPDADAFLAGLERLMEHDPDEGDAA